MQLQVRSADLERVARDARRAGRRDLLKEMSKGIRDDLRSVVPEIRTKVRAIPSRTGHQRSGVSLAERPRGLRDATARGVQMQVNLSGKRVGVRIRVDTRHFPRGSKTLPKYLEGVNGYERWFSYNWGRKQGRKGDWKTQPAHPYFFNTIEPHIPRVHAAIMREVDKVMRELTGGAP